MRGYITLAFINRKGREMTKRRVVITGMGAVTPCGIGVDNFWSAMVNG